MTITNLGEISISTVVPLLSQFNTALTAANGVAIPELQGKLLGLGNVLGAITVAPPSLGATITAAISTVASLQAAIGGPTVTLQASAIAAQITSLTSTVASLIASAGLAIPSSIVSAYSYDGPSGSLGAELQSALSSMPGVGGHCNALILATADPTVWTSMGLVFSL